MTVSQRRQSKHFLSNFVPTGIKTACVRPGQSKQRISQAQKECWEAKKKQAEISKEWLLIVQSGGC